MTNERSMNSAQDHKETAMEFLRLVASGKVREAYHKYVSTEFRHHNPYFRGDAVSLMIAMEENAGQYPDKSLEIQRALQDSDLVAVHSRVRLKPGDPGLALVHIFRFKEKLIVELWDIGQAIRRILRTNMACFKSGQIKVYT